MVDEMKRVIREIKNLSWRECLSTLNKLKNDDKEYFLKFYTEISKTVCILENIEITRNDENVITIYKKEIAKEIEKKYKKLLNNVNGKIVKLCG